MSENQKEISDARYLLELKDLIVQAQKNYEEALDEVKRIQILVEALTERYDVLQKAFVS